MSKSCWVIVWSSGATHSDDKMMHFLDSADAQETAKIIREDGYKGSQPIGVGKITLKPTGKS